MKHFEMPEIQVERFSAEDIMTISGFEPGEDPTPGNNGTPILPF